MAKTLNLPALVQKRIITMYEQGYKMGTIATETQQHMNTIRSVLFQNNTRRGARLLSNGVKMSKYQHLFEEPVCQGKDYKDYVKKN